MSAVVFLNLAIYLSKIFLLCLEIFLGVLHNKINNDHRQRQYQKCSQCHPHINGKHHYEYTDQGCDRCDQLGNALVQAHLKGIHVISHTGKNLTICPTLIIVHGKAAEFFGNIFS